MSANEIGLMDALDGNLDGLAKFVGYIDQQLRTLSIVSFPPDIAIRMQHFRRETGELNSYLSGYNDARPRESQK